MRQKRSAIEFVDSHTEGEPTRLIVSGAPDLGSGTVAQQLQELKQHDWFRRSVILEPRGWDALVGAVLCRPSRSDCVAGVIFINNAGYLGMCGHGTIGLAVTLHYLQRIPLGLHRIETPVGVVEVELLDANRVAIENVPSFRYRKSVSVDVPELGTVCGDIAWGGNWFFLVENSPVPLESACLEALNQATRAVKSALQQQGVTGEGNAEIDHVEFFGPGVEGDSRNYVLCPGGAYDRSPCGTGTSAKLACLAADGKLKPNEKWVQESIIGSRFETSFRQEFDGALIPRIEGRAFVCKEGRLLLDAQDPFQNGISV